MQWVIVGADRICANGDTRQQDRHLPVAIAARHHGVKFMVVAPSSTVDMETVDGSQIEIEQRDPGELYGVGVPVPSPRALLPGTRCSTSPRAS